ncbi:MAG TPA: hypothetical protein PK886_02635 [Candidatus Paceibacterota bacterium]|nr:hypothetical protein [Candidatus Paceibacterota bacterium]
MENNLTFKEAIDLAKDRICRMQKLEGKPWNAEGSFIELSKQVGDLAKVIMRYENYYYQETKSDKEVLKEEISDELADVLYVIIRLAHNYDINLEDAHIRAREKEDLFLKSKGL